MSCTILRLKLNQIMCWQMPYQLTFLISQALMRPILSERLFRIHINSILRGHVPGTILRRPIHTNMRPCLPHHPTALRWQYHEAMRKNLPRKFLRRQEIKILRQVMPHRIRPISSNLRCGLQHNVRRIMRFTNVRVPSDPKMLQQMPWPVLQQRHRS